MELSLGTHIEVDRSPGQVCREKRVNIAYINTKMGRGYEVNNETGEMVRYKVNPMTGYHSYISYHWEILDSFFKGGFQTLKCSMFNVS